MPPRPGHRAGRPQTVRLGPMADVTNRPARAFTYDDLKEMPDDGYRREIVGGSLIVTPAPLGRHQRAVVLITGHLLAAETPDTMVLAAPYDWRLPNGDSVQPDAMVILRTDFDPDGPLPSSATPLLVVEVLSASNASYDRLTKRALYESLGVRAYWIVDPRTGSLLALRLVEDHYQVEADLSGDNILVTDWPFPLRCNLGELR